MPTWWLQKKCVHFKGDATDSVNARGHPRLVIAQPRSQLWSQPAGCFPGHPLLRSSDGPPSRLSVSLRSSPAFDSADIAVVRCHGAERDRLNRLLTRCDIPTQINVRPEDWSPSDGPSQILFRIDWRHPPSHPQPRHPRRLLCHQRPPGLSDPRSCLGAQPVTCVCSSLAHVFPLLEGENNLLPPN